MTRTDSREPSDTDLRLSRSGFADMEASAQRMLVAYFTLRALAQRRPAQQRLQRRANPSRVRSLQIHSQHALLYLAVEGWRGEIIHWIRTGPDNHLERCKINDPSLNNWPALVEAVQGNIIADFPVINKSFNLSYSGTDR